MNEKEKGRRRRIRRRTRIGRKKKRKKKQKQRKKIRIMIWRRRRRKGRNRRKGRRAKRRKRNKNPRGPRGITHSKGFPSLYHVISGSGRPTAWQLRVAGSLRGTSRSVGCSVISGDRYCPVRERERKVSVKYAIMSVCMNTYTSTIRAHVDKHDYVHAKHSHKHLFT